MKLANRKRIEELEKVCKPGKKRSSYALVIYDADIHDHRAAGFHTPGRDTAAATFSSPNRGRR